ncbi:MAG: kelch repeat-containing protein [Ferruginibacter sp.]
MKGLLLAAVLFPFLCFSQNVGIGTNTPDASALLDIHSSSKGVLIPRVALSSTSTASPVTSPATGLLVYNTTDNTELKQGFYYWTGTAWQPVSNSANSSIPKDGIILFESRTERPGFTYIGSVSEDYNVFIGMGSGSWISLPAFPYSNNVISTSYCVFNNKLFVWSGQDNSYANYEQTGASYNPGTDTWTSMSTTNAPAGRWGNITVADTFSSGGWMYVWGGVTSMTGAGSVPVVTNTGGVYDLITNGWIGMGASPLSARVWHAAVWTGTGNKVIIWGGSNGSGTALGDGAVYNPATGNWAAMAASPLAARWGHTATWTGNRMIIWGGTNGTTIFNDGAAYDPVTNTWTSIAAETLTSPTYNHTAIFTGTEIIVFGGRNQYGTTFSCCRYNITGDAWSLAATSPGASATSFTSENHSAVWTGTEMIIAGGSNSFASLGLTIVRAYNPATDSWRLFNPFPGYNPKISPAVGWLNNQFVVQAGSWTNNTGFRFDPANGSPDYIETSLKRYFFMYRKN